MRDERKWKLGMAQFQALRMNVPAYIGVDVVSEYHSILTTLGEASDEDLSTFRIPDAEMKPRVVSFSMGTRRGPGRTNFSRENYCNSELFQRKIDSLSHFLPNIEHTPKKSLQPDGSKDYWAMSNVELEVLANKYHIGGYADQTFNIDRDIIISQLLKRDAAIQSEKPIVPTHAIHVESMVGSVIQQGTTQSNATVSFQIADVQRIIDKTRSAMAELPLNSEAKRNLDLDIRTIEPQLSSPNPKKVIIAECLRSMHTILVGAAGSILATGIVYEIDKVMKAMSN